MFQDDVMGVSLNLRSAQIINLKMESILESKLLDFNHDKSVCMLMGDKKFKTESLKYFNDCPLMLNSKPMKIVDNY